MNRYNLRTTYGARYKWHMFWFKRHLNWLSKKYEEDLFCAVWERIDKMIRYMKPVVTINTSADKITERILKDEMTWRI